MSNKQNSLDAVQQPQALQGDNDNVQQTNSVIINQGKKVDNYKEWLDQLTKEKQLVYSYPILPDEWKRKMRYFDKRNQIYGVTITFKFLEILLSNDFLESSQIQFYINIFRKMYPTIKCVAASCYFYAEFCPSSTDQLQIKQILNPNLTYNQNPTSENCQLNIQFQPITQNDSNLQTGNKEKTNQLNQLKKVESTDQQKEENKAAHQPEIQVKENIEQLQDKQIETELLKQEINQAETKKEQQNSSQIKQEEEQQKEQQKEQQTEQQKQHELAADQTNKVEIQNIQTLPTLLQSVNGNQQEPEKDPQSQTQNQVEQLTNVLQTQQIEQQITETNPGAQSEKEKEIQNNQANIQQAEQETVQNQDSIVQKSLVDKLSQQAKDSNIQNQKDLQEDEKLISDTEHSKIPPKEAELTDQKQQDNQVPQEDIKEIKQNLSAITQTELTQKETEQTPTEKVVQTSEIQQSLIIGQKQEVIVVEQKVQNTPAAVKTEQIEFQNEQSQSQQQKPDLADNKLEQPQKVINSEIGNQAEESRVDVSMKDQTQNEKKQTESDPLPEQIQEAQPKNLPSIENKQEQNKDVQQQLINTQNQQPTQPQFVQQAQPVQKQWVFKITTIEETKKVAEPIEGVYKLSKLDNLFQQIAEINGISKEDLGKQDYLYIPINQSQAHWISVILDLSKKEFHYFDSYYNSIDNVVKTGVDHIIQKLGFKMQFKIITHFNKQQNGYDCGIFSLMSLLYTLQQKFEYDYSQVEVTQWRRRILYDLAVICSQINLDQETFERIIEIKKS